MQGETAQRSRSCRACNAAHRRKGRRHGDPHRSHPILEAGRTSADTADTSLTSLSDDLKDTSFSAAAGRDGGMRRLVPAKSQGRPQETSHQISTFSAQRTHVPFGMDGRTDGRMAKTE